MSAPATSYAPPYALFATDEYEARVARARAAMERDGLDALLLTAKENVIYFSGIRTIGWASKHRPMGVIVPAAADAPVVMILPETLQSVAQTSSWITELRPWGGWRNPDAPRDPIAAFARACSELGLSAGAAIGLELGYGQRLGMSQEDFGGLRDALSESTLTDATSLLWSLRTIKSPAEVEALRAACEATDRAFARGFEALHAGMTERELAGVVMSELSLASHELPGFVMIRSGVEKYAMVNVEPYEKQMVPGDLVVLDVGANHHYYWSDFMRMASIGEPTAEQRRFIDANLAAQQAGIDVIRPGIALGDIFAACHEVLVDAGLAEHVSSLERVGHGVGLDMHEPPSIERGSTVPVEEGMVLTVEPIFWDKPDGRIGNFAIEDMVVVTSDGSELLSSYPRELHVVAA